jgi:hypothetical protein
VGRKTTKAVVSLGLAGGWGAFLLLVASCQHLGAGVQQVHHVSDLEAGPYVVSHGDSVTVFPGAPAGVISFRATAGDTVVVERALTPDEYAWIHYHAAAIAAGLHGGDGVQAKDRANLALVWTRRRWAWPESDQHP